MRYFTTNNPHMIKYVRQNDNGEWETLDRSLFKDATWKPASNNWPVTRPNLFDESSYYEIPEGDVMLEML